MYIRVDACFSSSHLATQQFSYILAEHEGANPGSVFPGKTIIAAEPATTFVDVGDGVKVEVVDWGGNKRALILLAGSGNSAHIYEDFAPKLAGSYHVYGINDNVDNPEAVWGHWSAGSGT
jgi:hypothetical protein